MSKSDKSLLELENKIGNYNEKENTLKNMRINKPKMDINLINNNKFNKGNLLSFLDKFKKENEKIMKDENKLKYNIENAEEESEEEEDIEKDNKIIELDEDKEENEDSKNKKKKNGTKIEMDLLMGILEQQKKKEITIENIIENKKNEGVVGGDDSNDKNIEKGEKEIIDFLLNNKEYK